MVNASTETPWPEAVEPWPTVAVLETLAMFSETVAPMAVLLRSELASPLAVASVSHH